VQARLTPMFTGGRDPGVSSRLEIWQVAWTMFKRSPLTGIGTTKFPYVRMGEATRMGKDYLAHAHSNPVHVLTTTGVIGFATYIWIVVCSLLQALKHLGRNTPAGTIEPTPEQRTERGFALGVFAAMLSLTVSGLAEYNFGTGQVRLALWFVLALLASDL
jgi:O-antigen ligase